MTRKYIPSNPRNVPLTTKELTGYELSSYDKEAKGGRPIVCSKCGMSGGTLVKVDDHYEHQDTEKCGIMQIRRKK